MNKRVNQPDTQADLLLRANLTQLRRQCFVMVAGAGSGKTTSLIKALSSIIGSHGPELKKNRQRVGCITYTEIAAGEIWADVGNNPLVHVSTIHSFMWMLVSSFQRDIQTWVLARIDEKLSELRVAAASFGPRVQQRTRDKNQRDILRYERERCQIPQVKSFTYGTGSDYSRGVLGHDDVLRIATQFLAERKLFRTLLAQQFPFLFVDESQDTSEGVVEALKVVATQQQGQFCLGFFGDPMQQIYMTGIGEVKPEANWIEIAKPENFRCPTSVLSVANAIRRGGDKLEQTRGRMITIDGVTKPVAGTARLFILPANDRRDEQVNAVREWVAEQNGDAAWKAGPSSSVKVLVIVHRMAASRLGFGNLYSALNDDAPEAIKSGFLDSTAWPVRPFIQFLLPLSNALRRGQEFEAMTILRKYCPRLRKEELSKSNVAKLLASLRAASLKLSLMMEPAAGVTVRQVLEHVRDQSLIVLDPRILAYLEERGNQTTAAIEPQQEEDNAKEPASVARFLACPVAELWGYLEYIEEQSPFSTQQGIKGAEFERVLVVADDDEGTHFQFSYEKYFGVKPPSDRDEVNKREGKETQVDRTRRLFYVCCTRAMTDLVVVWFTGDVPGAEKAVRAMNLFPANQVFTKL